MAGIPAVFLADNFPGEGARGYGDGAQSDSLAAAYLGSGKGAGVLAVDQDGDGLSRFSGVPVVLGQGEGDFPGLGDAERVLAAVPGLSGQALLAKDKEGGGDNSGD